MTGVILLTPEASRETDARGLSYFLLRYILELTRVVPRRRERRVRNPSPQRRYGFRGSRAAHSPRTTSL